MATEYIEQHDADYYVAGPRISPDSVVIPFRRGESPETICRSFRLLRLKQAAVARSRTMREKQMLGANAAMSVR